MSSNNKLGYPNVYIHIHIYIYMAEAEIDVETEEDMAHFPCYNCRKRFRFTDLTICEHCRKEHCSNATCRMKHNGICPSCNMVFCRHQGRHIVCNCSTGDVFTCRCTRHTDRTVFCNVCFNQWNSAFLERQIWSIPVMYRHHYSLLAEEPSVVSCCVCSDSYGINDVFTDANNLHRYMCPCCVRLWRRNLVYIMMYNRATLRTHDMFRRPGHSVFEETQQRYEDARLYFNSYPTTRINNNNDLSNTNERRFCTVPLVVVGR